MNKITINLIAIFCISGIIACGGSKTALINQSDIRQAQKNGTLEVLYDQAGKIAAESRGSSKREIVIMQSEIAKLLVQERVALVNRTLKNDKTEYGTVAKDKLNDLQMKTANMKLWDNKRYEMISQMIEKSLDDTKLEIASAQANAKDRENNIVEQMKWMKKIAVLSGENTTENENYKKELTKNIEQLSTKSLDAYKRRMYNIALKSAQSGVNIDPGNIQFESLLMQSQAALFEQEFRAALENGKPELAYQAFIKVADKPLMRQIKEKMERSIILLANYFAGNAQKSYENNELYIAYTEFQRARDVQKKLSLSSRGFIQEKKFLDILMKKASLLQNNDGHKFGLLSVVNEFDPAYPTLEQNMAKTRENIYNRAATKLSVSEFKEVLSSNSVVASVGRRVASQLEKTLFEQLGNELQIVANSSAVQNDGFSGIVLAVDGEVLQAAIESSKNLGQRSLSVQTGINKIETAEYKKWKKRKRGDAPTQYSEEKIMENVTIQVANIRKFAVVEVAYRIIEPSTQKVLLTNNIVKEAKYKGDSTNEFQKGMFHQAYVEADLPSDIKIMDNLSSELSEELGKSLVKYLASPEGVFYQKYRSSVDQGDSSTAIEMLSNAVVIAKRKNSPNSEWLATLKKRVLEMK